jgi:chromosome segregation ATPase
MLAGVTIKAPTGSQLRASRSGGQADLVRPGPTRSDTVRQGVPAKPDREAAKAREQKLALERAVREADQKARHAEFEAARAARDASKAEKKLEEAQRALDEARATMKETEAEAAAAVKAKEAADRRVHDARSALDAARAKFEAT